MSHSNTALFKFSDWEDWPNIAHINFITNYNSIIILAFKNIADVSTMFLLLPIAYIFLLSQTQYVQTKVFSFLSNLLESPSS